MDFKQLSETETEQFKLWAWDNYKPNSEILADVWHPVVVLECELINAAANAWRDESETETYRQWFENADPIDSDNYWASFHFEKRMFDFCAYYTGGVFTVVVYECVRVRGYYWETNLDVERFLPKAALGRIHRNPLSLAPPPVPRP
tara:strand:+ start:200 stop:637 length:438 start_codon:yes stop_codon:yes gene_type:complete